MERTVPWLDPDMAEEILAMIDEGMIDRDIEISQELTDTNSEISEISMEEKGLRAGKISTILIRLMT